MKSAIDKTNKFHLFKDSIPGVVRKMIKKDQIIYGGKAINKQVTPYLKSQAKDFDIYSKTPKLDAERLESALDKHSGADLFHTKAAKHRGTFKVKNIRGETVADFTQMPSKIKSKLIMGVNYETIESMAPKIRKTIKMPSNRYRKEKDLDNLNRIKLMKKLVL